MAICVFLLLLSQTCLCTRSHWQTSHLNTSVGPEEVTNVIRGLQHFCYKGRQRDLGLFKWMLWGDLRTAFQHLKGSYTKEGEWLFTWADSDRTRQKSFKLEEGRFRFDNWKKFFTVRLLRHWNKLPRETEDASSLDVFKLRSLRNLI